MSDKLTQRSLFGESKVISELPSSATLDEATIKLVCANEALARIVLTQLVTTNKRMWEENKALKLKLEEEGEHHTATIDRLNEQMHEFHDFKQATHKKIVDSFMDGVESMNGAIDGSKIQRMSGVAPSLKSTLMDEAQMLCKILDAQGSAGRDILLRKILDAQGSAKCDILPPLISPEDDVPADGLAASIERLCTIKKE